MSDELYDKDGWKLKDVKYEEIRINNVFVPDRIWLIIGKGTERDIRIGTTATFNWFQKKIWKFLFNIDIEDIKENRNGKK